jgi:Zn-finger nucleic acid-binding protein
MKPSNKVKGVSMDCPSCSTELERRMIREIEVDECPDCKGIWFEDDELRKAKDSADSDLNWIDFEIWKYKDRAKARSKDLPCPDCRKALVAIDYTGTDVEVDYCPSCKGIWLDKGEFKSIIKALTDELLTKSFSEYVKASIEEAKEVVAGPEPFLSEWKDFATVCRMMQYRLFVENPKLAEEAMIIQQTNPIK